MRIDKIRQTARRHAWYHNFEDSDGPRTYNFFGRIDTRRKPKTDEENQLRQISTENDATSPVQERRRQDNAPWPPPDRAGTFPQDRQHGDYTQHDRGDFSSSENARSLDTDEKTGSKAPEHAPEGTMEQSVTSNSQNGKPRKRNKFLGIIGRKEESEEGNEEEEEKKKKKKRKPSPKLTVMSQVKAVFLSWINILLVCVPVGIGLEYSGVNKVVVFVINFLAIIPLASILSYSTEELALYIGEVLGGLLNATFGNAVELIVSIIALVQGRVLIVQTSLIGSMLSNLLLVMGMCFFFGGINRPEQYFNITVAQTASSLLALAIGSLIIPTAFRIFADVDTGVTPTSRGTAVLLLVTYACYLFFQLRTHVEMYNEPSKKVPKRSTGKKEAGDALKGIATVGAASGAATAGGSINRENLVHDAEEEEETPQLTRLGAIVTLAISTVFIALCAEYMVSAINVVSKDVSQEFIGLILLPIVGNAAEHATAVTVAIKDKMDLSIGVAVGSSLQIALLVLPLMVMLNWWGVGAPADLDLNFDGFLIVVLVIAIWLVNYLIADGKSHWLEGVLLMITYLIIAIAAWFYPAKGDVAG
ncbi:Vacuolar calcium ion transporter [Lecanosticta acicola]|uniref:Vacuolar calcium ion transporter n=1 Tax=Lecanosticta acicola TaxID=111012 RepID=A0AAI8YVW9_9PEZI|nr:Vacuolar calcium ion transporter [Lecanosticta acicola]